MTSSIRSQVLVRSRPARRAHRRPAASLLIWVALFPLLLILGVFSYFPAVSGIFWSFFDWVPAGKSTFIGFDNYARILTDTGWWSSFRNLGIIFVFSVVAWVLPLLAAELLITLRSSRWKFVVRTLLVLPMAFPGVVTALVWGFLYNPNAGVINQFLSSIGLDSLRHNWTGSPDSALLALLFVGFPFIAGLPFLVFYSSLENIPSEVLEAAQLDGVGRWGRFWRIDLPLMASQVRILAFLVVVSTLQYGFAAYVLTGGGPDNATTVPVLWMIDQAFTAGNWGYAAALSTVLFAMTVVISGVVLLFRGRASNADGGEM